MRSEEAVSKTYIAKTALETREHFLSECVGNIMRCFQINKTTVWSNTEGTGILRVEIQTLILVNLKQTELKYLKDGCNRKIDNWHFSSSAYFKRPKLEANPKFSPKILKNIGMD